MYACRIKCVFVSCNFLLQEKKMKKFSSHKKKETLELIFKFYLKRREKMYANDCIMLCATVQYVEILHREQKYNKKKFSLLLKQIFRFFFHDDAKMNVKGWKIGTKKSTQNDHPSRYFNIKIFLWISRCKIHSTSDKSPILLMKNGDTRGT